MSGEKVIYINGEKHNNCYITSGISFSDFLASSRRDIENMILLKHRFSGADFHFSSHFDFIEGKEEIQKLAKDKSSHYDHFYWVDFKDISNLDELEPTEIASLLYLGHMREPLEKAMYSRLRNSFAYFATGNYTKVYYRYLQDFIFMLGSVIPMQINKESKTGIFSFLQKQPVQSIIPIEEMKKLLPDIETGLIINLDDREETKKVIKIPLYRNQSTLSTVDDESSALFAYLVYGKKERVWNVLFND